MTLCTGRQRSVMAEAPIRRLAMIGPIAPPAGGMANQTRQLMQLLESEGIEVSLVPVNAPYRPAWIGRLRGLRAVFRLLGYIPRLWGAAGKAELFHVMANSGWAWHLYAAPAIWVATLRRIPVVVNYRGGGAEQFFEKSYVWVKSSLRRASAVIVPSGYLHDVFDRWGVKNVVVPNIIDTELFQRRPTRKDEQIATNPHLVVCRNLEPIYGIDTAIKAFASIKNLIPGARLTIAGGGWQLQELQDLVQVLGISSSIHFTGSLSAAQMADLYRNADIFLNTSRVDNMPNSLLEAMACGVPVVSSKVGGIPYIAEDGKTALLVPPDDEQATASALLRLIREPDLRSTLANRAWQQVQAYVWPRVREQLFAIYDDMAPCRRGAAQPGRDSR